MQIWPTLVDTICPLLLVTLVAFRDLVPASAIPALVKAFWTRLSSPFHQLIATQDLDGVDYTLPKAVAVHRALTIISTVTAFGWLTSLCYSIVIGNSDACLQMAILMVCWVFVALKFIRRPPHSPPYVLIAFGLFQLVGACLSITSHSLRDGLPLAMLALQILLNGSFIYAAGKLPLEPIRPTPKVARADQIPSSDLTSPEDDAHLWSWLSASYVEPILTLAWERTLQDTDVWSLSPLFQHKNLFKKRVEYRNRYPDQSLLRFLIASNSLDFIIVLGLELWGTVVGFVPAYSLQRILASLDNPTEESMSTAYLFAFVTFMAHLSFAQVDLFKNWHTRRVYERTRGLIFISLFEKALMRRDVSGKVSGDEEETSADLGKIVNLMQGDAYAVAQRFWDFAALISSPLRLTIALVFLYRVLGWSAISGVFVVLIAYILNYPLAMYNISITRASWKSKDKRMNVVNELLQNIRFLKYYGWEYKWSDSAREARETELGWRVRENIVGVAISFIWTWIPSATALSTFAWYTLIEKEQLTVSKAFTAVALFSQIQEPMTALPDQFFALLHAYVSMQRIDSFLKEAEVPDWACSLKMPIVDSGRNTKIGFHDAIFEWSATENSSNEPRFVLDIPDLLFPVGKLTLVNGPTGSGKSALLGALLGEMYLLKGTVYLDKTNHLVAYCAQNPWLEHATIRANVIFGARSGFDEERYEAVLEACALNKDLDMFEAGDMTEIGEKGITLSGGQRARVALARAIYSDAEVILLDDPLAAVDMHTAKHLVEQCLQGPLMRNRTVILITHHVSLCLPIASYFVELAGGKIHHHHSASKLRYSGLREADMKEDETPSTEISQTLTPENEADLGVQTSRKPRGDNGKGRLIEAEFRAEGRVPFKTYWTYIRAAGILSWVLTITLMIVIRFVNIGNQVFLAKWGEAYDVSPEAQAQVLPEIHYPWDNLPPPDEDVKPWLHIYLYISIVGGFSVLSYMVLGYYASLQASRTLFLRLLVRLTRAPARFFDVTPIGRILNRFTSDINTIDGTLQPSARAALSGVLNFVASFGVIIVMVPTFAPFAAIIALLYIRLAPKYIQVQRDLRRLESISLSPAFAGFDELLRGLAHVRAFSMETRYLESFFQKVDKFQSFDHFYWIVNGWLRWRYDCLGSTVVYLATVFSLWQGVTNGSAAVVIVQAGIFAEASRVLVRVLAQLELDFNAVERVVEYLQVPQEAPAKIPKNAPPAAWPSTSGDLIVEDLEVKYAPDLPPVLKNISVVIKPSQKVGVVGRTGSGKSTFASALLRMVEPSGGHIIIDGVDIAKIGLEDLRTRITIVSQDVSLFAGTLRSNLDPFSEHTDQACWDVLKRCHLLPLLSHSSTKGQVTLDMPISQGGSLSAGERQLVALARAILRRTSIVIMDEATSQIDTVLDEQIQKTIREELSASLVITIAHRLKTIIEYDQILVLDAGRVVEFGTPKDLLKVTDGKFSEMCRSSADWGEIEDKILTRSNENN
ncbi:pleiotropic drug resistance ABC transporter [Coniophora puteana RWD-64-598 SS2]|uniref:Pleiotropic drug resistance ABC transporter n=1 Tax=Coniophora puteana (strain RWD-64-598) TaxID=741705 RepID=A0A5M3N6M8_CONPW|nr:pleiotropic drug resistance ABC transporter [Coniophora puteana RWD-64-598 SS2]EIW86976.1 pleiotropic drug resistance ABC transporter [Coniophora puteana RWD-64-598 SS2]